MLSSGACAFPSLPSFLRSPERSFTVQDLLITIEDLPHGWKVKSGPGKLIDNSRSFDTVSIDFTPVTEPDRRPVLQMVFRYDPIWGGAKHDYSEHARFSSNTVIEEWSFESETADESKFSCYTYSNKEYPNCRWLARYEEFVVDTIIHFDPEIMSFEEMKSIIVAMDQKMASYLNDE